MAGQVSRERYKDLDLDFTAHPVSGDVVQKLNKDAIKQSLKNLLRMGRFDKPFQPQINSRIKQLLFEPDTPLTKIEIKKSVTDIIGRWEPRVIMLDVAVDYNIPDNSYNITMTYNIINQPSVETVSLQLARLK